MGEIPSFDNMVSTIITSPENVEDLEPDTTFDIKMQVSNLIAGVFTNPTITYYSAPQRLEGGKIVGHVHVRLMLPFPPWLSLIGSRLGHCSGYRAGQPGTDP
jgi:transcription initiation factor TFIID subunit 15